MRNKKKEKIETKKKPRFLWGFTAGAVGGVAGAVAIVAMERLSAPRGAGELLPIREADAWTSNRTKQTASSGQPIHWAVGALAGGVYGMVAEAWPQVTESNGAAFGLVLEAVTHEAPMAAGGLLSGLLEQSPLGRAGNVTTHAAYGMTAEFVRKHMRSWLESRDKKHRREVRRELRPNVNLKLPA